VSQLAHYARGSRSLALKFDWRQNVIYVAFVIALVLFTILLGDQGFFTTNNLLSIFRSTASIVVMAVAVTFVIAAGEIDLSIGATAGFASVVTAMLLGDVGLWPAVAAGIGAGALIGVINGGIVAWLNVPSFLVTLGMLGLVTGVARYISDSSPIAVTNQGFINLFGGADIGPIPGLMIWALAFVVIGAVVMHRTKFGRQVLATGGNLMAARYTGVNTARIKFAVLALSGVVAAVAGLLYTGRLYSGRFQWGTGDELSVIAAVILGGTSLFGGNGRIVGTLFGAIFIGLVNNGLVLLGLDVSQQQVIRGAIIIAAVALSTRKA
jgi:ribose transport system permease protein